AGGDELPQGTAGYLADGGEPLGLIRPLTRRYAPPSPQWGAVKRLFGHTDHHAATLAAGLDISMGRGHFRPGEDLVDMRAEVSGGSEASEFGDILGALTGRAGDHAGAVLPLAHGPDHFLERAGNGEI